MVEKDKAADATAKAKAPKKAAAPKPAAKAAAKKPAGDGKTITLIQTGSPIGRQGYQRATLIGLGLNKMNKERTLIDTPSVRGMIEKVKHLVAILEA